MRIRKYVGSDVVSRSSLSPLRSVRLSSRFAGGAIASPRSAPALTAPPPSVPRGLDTSMPSAVSKKDIADFCSRGCSCELRGSRLSSVGCMHDRNGRRPVPRWLEERRPFSPFPLLICHDPACARKTTRTLKAKDWLPLSTSPVAGEAQSLVEARAASGTDERNIAFLSKCVRRVTILHRQRCSVILSGIQYCPICVGLGNWKLGNPIRPAHSRVRYQAGP